MKIGRYQTVTVGKECVHGLQGKARVVRKFIGGVLSFCIISRETVTSCGYMGQALWFCSSNWASRGKLLWDHALSCS
ncbi:unnamed protein product, partial [Vitis vinifera]|uniref:Uncharacterized protein n=1 Tax=Vitis vinifera TaxID=29760 RepID=D7SJ43_VITVI